MTNKANEVFAVLSAGFICQRCERIVDMVNGVEWCPTCTMESSDLEFDARLEALIGPLPHGYRPRTWVQK